MEIDDFSRYILIFNAELSSEDQDKTFCALQQLNYIEPNRAGPLKCLIRTEQVLDLKHRALNRTEL